MKTAKAEVKMFGLTDEVRRWNNTCGLTGRHLVTKIVLAYAENKVTDAEYVEYFKTWHKLEQEHANKLIQEIAAVADMERMLGRRI